jgi:hypothetical protein
MHSKTFLLASISLALLLGFLLHSLDGTPAQSGFARVEDQDERNANDVIDLLPKEDRRTRSSLSRFPIVPKAGVQHERLTFFVVDELCGTPLKYDAKALGGNSSAEDGVEEWSVSSPGYRQRLVSPEVSRSRVELRAKTEVVVKFVNEDSNGQRKPVEGVHLVRAQKVIPAQESALWNISEAFHQFVSDRYGHVSIFSNEQVRCEWQIEGYPNVTAIAVPGRRNTVVICGKGRPYTRFKFIDHVNSRPIVNLDVELELAGTKFGRVRTDKQGEASFLIPFGPATFDFAPAVEPIYITSSGLSLDFAKIGQARYTVVREAEIDIEVQCKVDRHQLQVHDQFSGSPISGVLSYATVRPLEDGRYYTVGKAAKSAIRDGIVWVDLAAFLYSEDWRVDDRLALDVTGFKREIFLSPDALKATGSVQLERAEVAAVEALWEDGDAVNDKIDIYSSSSSELLHTFNSGDGVVAEFWWDGGDLIVSPRSSGESVTILSASVVPGEVATAHFSQKGSAFELLEVPSEVANVVLLSASIRAYSDPVSNIIPCYVRDGSDRSLKVLTWKADDIPAGRYYFGTLDGVRRDLMQGVRDGFEDAVTIEDGGDFVATWSDSGASSLTEDTLFYIDGVVGSRCEFVAVPLNEMDGKVSFTQLRDMISVGRDGRFVIPSGRQAPDDILLMVVPKSSHPGQASPLPLGVYPANGTLFVAPGKLSAGRIEVSKAVAGVSPVVCSIDLDLSEMGNFSRYFSDVDVEVDFISVDGFDVDCFARVTQKARVSVPGARTLIPTRLERVGADAVIVASR